MFLVLKLDDNNYGPFCGKQQAVSCVVGVTTTVSISEAKILEEK
jgi:hypothetical protein